MKLFYALIAGLVVVVLLQSLGVNLILGFLNLFGDLPNTLESASNLMGQ